MKLVATIPARNEQWVLGASVAAALQWCDCVVVMDHAGEPAATAFIDDLYTRHRGRFDWFREGDPTWREAAYRQKLLDVAKAHGATHVALIDADEILTANAVPLIRDEVAELKVGQVLRIPWLMLWGSLDRVRAGDSSVWSNATVPMAFPVDGVSWQVGGYDIHTRCPPGLAPRVAWADRNKGLMHLQHVSRRRLHAKQRLYRLTEKQRWGTDDATLERRYGPATDETGMRLEGVMQGWWSGIDRDQITPDDAPWQEAELESILRTTGSPTPGT